MASLGRYERNTNIWPGFVDALATLLMVIIFLLMIFVLAQFFLGQALSGRDTALQRLESQVSELADLLALEKRANTNLTENLSQLSEQLQTSVSDRDDLRATVGALRANADETQAKMDDMFEQILSDKETLRDQGLELAELAQDITSLRALRAELETQVSTLATRASLLKSLVEKEMKARSAAESSLATTASKLSETASKLAETKSDLASTTSTLSATRSKLTKTTSALSETASELESTKETVQVTIEELEAARRAHEKSARELAASQRAHEKSQTALNAAQHERDTSRSNLDTIRRTLLQEKDLSKSARAQLALLNQQMSALRRQLANLEQALEVSENLTNAQKTQIFNLGKRLNAALASKVQELSRYRSEFFGRLRDVLGRQQGIQVAGDRFVFQSEVLFDKGSASIGSAGKDQLTALAATLRNIAAKIPNDIDWVLRVDGHTDNDPIATLRFPSNWELSSARAIAVVRQLVANGLPPNRLVAAGFGEFQPIDANADEIAKRRNRRIELKLTQR